MFQFKKNHLFYFVCLVFLIAPMVQCAEFADVFNAKPQSSKKADQYRYYYVKQDDTFETVSKKYGVSAAAIAKVNQLDAAQKLEAGKKIKIPLKKPTKAPATKPETQQSTPVEPQVKSFNVIWPVKGIVSSGFGPRGSKHHDGIDISADTGEIVHAAAAGQVIHVGTLSGYGNLIVVKHSQKYFTAYGHLSSFKTRKGKTVKQGEPIGVVGKTGRTHSKKPVLHFEIRDRTDAKNPLDFLPEIKK